MPDEFDAVAAGQSLAELVASTAADVRPLVQPSPRPPIFRTLKDGSVVDRNENKMRGPVEPLSGKGK
jgi:hypothetical protein